MHRCQQEPKQWPFLLLGEDKAYNNESIRCKSREMHVPLYHIFLFLGQTCALRALTAFVMVMTMMTALITVCSSWYFLYHYFLMHEKRMINKRWGSFSLNFSLFLLSSWQWSLMTSCKVSPLPTAIDVLRTYFLIHYTFFIHYGSSVEPKYTAHCYSSSLDFMDQHLLKIIILFNKNAKEEKHHK